ncbi:hypothetical protein [Thaumasiovibrio sp. DFM-14]|uniref:hypothetical protein n=1 Tax=Thaumasiovibrio sp. DFM-14 TaxID=3384792 RepID=UPI0039A1E7EC
MALNTEALVKLENYLVVSLLVVLLSIKAQRVGMVVHILVVPLLHGYPIDVQFEPLLMVMSLLTGSVTTTFVLRLVSASLTLAIIFA